MAYFIRDQDSKKGKTPTDTSLMESITSKKKHMLMFSSQTTPTNTSPSINGICRTSITAYRRHVTDSRRSRVTDNPQYHHGKDDGQEG